MFRSEVNSRIVRNAVLTACVLAPVFSSVEALAQKASNTSKVGGTGLYEIVASQSTGDVYVASTGGGGRGSKNSGKIYRLNPQTLSVTDSIEVPGAKPMGLAINDKTQTLYTSSPGDIPMNAINLKTGKVTPIKTEEQAHIREIVVDEAKNLIYATNLGEKSSIWVIDGKTNAYLYSIPDCGQTTTSLALNQSKQFLYVTLMKTNEIGVVDLAAKKMIRTFSAHGSKPINIEYDNKTDRLFIADQGTNEVIVLKAADGGLIKKIPAGKGTLGVRFDPVKKRVYTANRQEGTVTVINSDTYEVIATLEAGSAPNTVAVNTKTGIAYVSNKTKAQPRAPRPEGGQQGARVQGDTARPARPAGQQTAQADRPVPVPDPNGDTVTMIVP